MIDERDAFLIRTQGSRTTKVKGGKWKIVKLKCFFGHEYQGQVRKIRFNGHDMDGDELWYKSVDDFNPLSCIVCGMKTYEIAGLKKERRRVKI